MKRALLLLALPVCLFVSCVKEQVVNAGDIPAASANYITTHFPEQAIVHAVKAFDDLRITYTVYLKNGVKIEFDQNGEVKEIEAKDALPDSVIPAAILDHVKNNYPSAFIKKWEMESTKQEVALSNGITLEFDKNGNFLRGDN